MINALTPKTIKKIVFFICAFAITESVFADSTSVPGVQINWTTNIPAKAESNQKTDSPKKQASKNANIESIPASPAPESSISNIWLLPTSRFYFLKNWRREFERLTTFGDKKRIELELGITDDIANEMKALKNKFTEAQTRFDANKATDAALRAYTTAHYFMRERTIRVWEKLADNDRDKLLDKIAKQISKHSKIFAGTADPLNMNSAKIKPLIDGIKSNLQETTEALMQKTDAQSFALKLGETAKSVLQNSYPLTTTTRAGFFERLIEKASDTARSTLQSAKIEILNAIAKKLKSL